MGLAPLATNIPYGLWCLGGPLAGYIFKAKGAALFGELFGDIVEMFLGSQWGVATIFLGLMKGIGSELGFAILGYRNFEKLSLVSSVITTTVFTFAWNLFDSGYLNYSIRMLVFLFSTRLISIALFSGGLTALIGKLLDKSHALDSIQSK